MSIFRSLLVALILFLTLQFISSGAWLIHLLLITCLKIIFDAVPGVTQQMSWTFTNLTYTVGSFLMFHFSTGVPFDYNAGAYDHLTTWEQIDNGVQYTPARKFLLSVPIMLFLISTHYTQYSLTYFVINLIATLAVVIPKLPSVGPSFCTLHVPPVFHFSNIRPVAYAIQFHRLRIGPDSS